MSSRVMGRPKRLADRIVDDALEAMCAARHAADWWQQALADPTRPIAHPEQGLQLVERVAAATAIVVPGIEEVNQRQKLVIEYLSAGQCRPTSIRDAATIRLLPPGQEAA